MSLGRRGGQFFQTLRRSLSHQSTRQLSRHQVTDFPATWFEAAKLLNPFAGVTEVSFFWKGGKHQEFESVRSKQSESIDTWNFDPQI